MDIFTGFIAAFGFSFAPRYWAQCAGQILAIPSNTALFSLLGTQYGGDGNTTFWLPELRGRAAIGYGQSPSLPYFAIGEKDGSIETTISSSELPTHTHIAVVTGGGGAPVTGSLQASTAPADHGQPAQGDYLASIPLTRTTYTPSYASSSTGGTQLVELSGLTVQGGGGGTPSVTNSSTGQGQPFSIMQPILAINYCIVMQGIYPSRN